MNDQSRDELQGETPDERAERDALVAAYALGSASAAEAAEARQFIVDDAEAARLYDEFAAITAVLPEIYADADAVPARPSAALRDRVLAAARAEMRDVPVASAGIEPREAPALAAPMPIALADARGRKRVALLSGWLAAAALLIAVIGLGAWNISLHRDVQQAERDRDIVRFAASGVHAYTMAGTQNAPAANATLIESSADGGRVVFLAKGFPGAAPGQTYRVWLQKQDGSYVDAGTFNGGDQTTLVLPGNLNGIHAVVITAEPASTPATTPTGPPVMEGTLT
jgi:anti-sigma-K factor RskA